VPADRIDLSYGAAQCVSNLRNEFCELLGRVLTSTNRGDDKGSAGKLGAFPLNGHEPSKMTLVDGRPSRNIRVDTCGARRPFTGSAEQWKSPQNCRVPHLPHPFKRQQRVLELEKLLPLDP